MNSSTTVTALVTAFKTSSRIVIVGAFLAGHLAGGLLHSAGRR